MISLARTLCGSDADSEVDVWGLRVKWWIKLFFTSLWVIYRALRRMQRNQSALNNTESIQMELVLSSYTNHCNSDPKAKMTSGMMNLHLSAVCVCVK